MKLFWLSVVFIVLAAGQAGATTAAEGGATAETAPAESATLQEDALSWLRDLLLMKVGGNSFAQILACFMVLLATLFLRRFIVQFVFSRLKTLSRRTRWKFDERLVPVLERPISVFTMIVGIFIPDEFTKL